MVEEQKKSVVQSKIERKNTNKEHFAIVHAKNLPISTKFSVEITSYIRNKSLKKAREILSNVIQQKIAIPFKRYNRDLGHKPGIASGRYPIKASKFIIKLLDAAEANAEYKGLNVNNLIISEIVANQGSKIWHSGRKRRRQMKRTHLKIKVEETQK